MLSLDKSSNHHTYATELVERTWVVDFYTNIKAITHGGRIVKVTIYRPGMSLEFSCPEGNSNIYDEAIQHLINIKHAIPPEPDYKKVSDDVPVD